MEWPKRGFPDDMRESKNQFFHTYLLKRMRLATNIDLSKAI